jgi:hypothetical protein
MDYLRELQSLNVSVMIQKNLDTCSSTSDNDAYCFGPVEPDFLSDIPEDARESRILMDQDLCVVDASHYFIRGCLDLPIVGTGKVFTWLVWVSLSKRNLDRAVAVWDSHGRESEPPYFGWLNTRLPGYPETIGLKTNVHTMPVGERPIIMVEPTNHLLAIEQRDGISLARAESLSKLVRTEWI